MLFLIIKYWCILRILSFLIEIWSTEKSYSVPFNKISFCLSFVKSCDMLPKQNFYRFIFFFGLNLQISVLFTYNELSLALQCKLKQYFRICFTKVNIFFSTPPVLSLMPRFGPTSDTKKLFFSIISMR